MCTIVAWLIETPEGKRATSEHNPNVHMVPLYETEDPSTAVAARFIGAQGVGSILSTNFNTIARYATYAWVRHGFDSGDLIFLTTNG